MLRRFFGSSQGLNRRILGFITCWAGCFSSFREPRRLKPNSISPRNWKPRRPSTATEILCRARFGVETIMLYPVSEVRNFVTGLDHPEGVAVGRDGTLYAGGETGQVYSISADGTEVKTLGSTGGFCLGITLDPQENIYICDCARRSLIKMTQAGAITVVADSIGGRGFANPNFSVFDANNNLYFSDSGEWKRAGGVVYRLSAEGSLKVFAPGPFHFANGL